LADGQEAGRRAKAAALAADDGRDVVAAVLRQLAPVLPERGSDRASA
jgi:hypothetical protein